MKDLREKEVGEVLQTDRNISPSLQHCLDLNLRSKNYLAGLD